jgi:hypothetical protein
MNVLKDYSKDSFLLWLVVVKFCIFFIYAFTMVVYTELAVGSTLTWSLYRFFTRYLSFAISLRNSIRGFVFFTPDMKIGGCYCSSKPVVLLFGI